MTAALTCEGETIDPLHQSCVIAERPLSKNPDEEATLLHDLYRSLSSRLGLGDALSQEPPAFPYNLLMTESWMALISRSQEHVMGFSINALGFAGYLLATQRSDLSWLQSHGGEQLLRRVVPGSSDSTEELN
ncbi:MAG: Uncharacterised protein [Cyanobium sp. ARS6]|nr:MAG: Uncharacterised protein [Cyanobium sp. ARS6]